VIILSVFLALFLILGMIFLIMLIRLTVKIRRIAQTVGETADNVKQFVDNVKKIASPAVVTQLVVRWIRNLINKKKGRCNGQ